MVITDELWEERFRHQIHSGTNQVLCPVDGGFGTLYVNVIDQNNYSVAKGTLYIRNAILQYK